MDAVVTTRLHGLVLALKHGVPAVAIDPVIGGAKITQQARAVGWPAVHSGAELDQDELGASLDFCLSEGGRKLARESAERARSALDATREEFLRAIRS
jgi:polysaccharide pyruvyl transferase WcaK-like protein